MFSSVNSMVHVAGLYLLDRGLLALRWGLDVTRGYQRVADGKEWLHRCLRIGARAVSTHSAERYADSAQDSLLVLSEVRAEPGPLGVGARLALSERELREFQIATENLRSEALRREQQNTGAQA